MNPSVSSPHAIDPTSHLIHLSNSNHQLPYLLSPTDMGNTCIAYILIYCDTHPL